MTPPVPEPASATLDAPILDGPTERLCAGIADGALAPVKLAVVAPGQYGKTALLDHLERACAGNGMTVARYQPYAPPPADLLAERELLVLVDDAHELDPAELATLSRLAADARVGIVLAARPMPRPDGLDALLGRLRGQIVLRPFDVGQVHSCLRAAGATAVSRELARTVQRCTGGVPGFVAEIARATSGDASGHPAQPADGDACAACVAPVYHELQQARADTMTVLLAAEAGASLDLELLAELLDTGQDDVAAVLETARATGLFDADGALLQVGAHALRSFVPAERRDAMRQRIVELRMRDRQPVLPTVLPWMDSGHTGSGFAPAFTTAAEEVMGQDPALAARLFDAAVRAGRPLPSVASRWAEAAARSGEMDTALRLADHAIASEQAHARDEGAQIAAIAHAHRGQLARSAEVARWAGTGYAAVWAAIADTATGGLADAERELHGANGRAQAPTLRLGAAASLARGIVDSVSRPADSVLSTLVTAADELEPAGRDMLLADSPAALAAIAAMHTADLDLAETVLERALATGAGGATLRPRQHLLHAWAALLRGDTGVAAERKAAVARPLAPRDELFAVALDVGIARRERDRGALSEAWTRASTTVIRLPSDLFTLLPLGELVVAAARLGEPERVGGPLRRSLELLRELGEPPLWSGQLHWSRLHAALVTDDSGRASACAAALATCAEREPRLAPLGVAARCWLGTMTGDIDVAAVENAADGLAGAGLRWEASRLAGQAAIRVADRADMRRLLNRARAWHEHGGTGPPADGAGAAAPAGAGALSAREREVAELVVAGMTYKQVGARLFISAKTVEHHVARMRQRLGCTSRAELLSQLSTLLGR
ncbi:helix-turn-helix transcriptional regulator [Haloechinothrix sp. LS1_15]|uniref:helix-turn-helix transcriptional regulator n=1 Tax=Haloechinothrix sp. LS1_15 TaxID=2652248 RepID=UPI0029466574|nr:helix-turn-helix transcriptional regulator [Haloechinothrix sp. LS1_15]MDV6014648.1 LuxR family transcriptional regulator [Haloechinothrix sp. LS1_15]